MVISTAGTKTDNRDVSIVLVLSGRAQMLQWKPRFYAVLTLAALAVAAFGGYADAGDTLRQFGW